MEEIAGEDALRVEEDFGGGFVRLKSSEAEKRQAAQDIRSSEDIVVELLRNSRDAGAKNIYLSMHKEGTERILVILDDGSGIPADMTKRIFQPRVTSKLDSAHLDKWGMHGRGMALYSIKVNAQEAAVCRSEPGRGAAIKVVTDTTSVSEKADQSSFPYFEETEGTYSMRGPKNIIRNASEFAFDCRKGVNVYCGSPTEIASTLYANGLARIPASHRLFSDIDAANMSLTDLAALAEDASSLSACLADLGLVISERSARRIMDGEIAPLPTLVERLAHESFPKPSASEGHAESATVASTILPAAPPSSKVAISQDDLGEFSAAVAAAFSHLAKKYYLADTEPTVTQRGHAIQIKIELVRDDQ